jgi:hypothetical protein
VGAQVSSLLMSDSCIIIVATGHGQQHVQQKRAWDGCNAVYLSYDIDSIEAGFVPGTILTMMQKDKKVGGHSNLSL